MEHNPHDRCATESEQQRANQSQPLASPYSQSEGNFSVYAPWQKDAAQRCSQGTHFSSKHMSTLAAIRKKSGLSKALSKRLRGSKDARGCILDDTISGIWADIGEGRNEMHHTRFPSGNANAFTALHRSPSPGPSGNETKLCFKNLPQSDTSAWPVALPGGVQQEHTPLLPMLCMIPQAERFCFYLAF